MRIRIERANRYEEYRNHTLQCRCFCSLPGCLDYYFRGGLPAWPKRLGTKQVLLLLIRNGEHRWTRCPATIRGIRCTGSGLQSLSRLEDENKAADARAMKNPSLQRGDSVSTSKGLFIFVRRDDG